MDQWRRGLAWLVSSASGLLSMLAGYSLVSTLWRQLQYGGDALGPAWGRILLQAGVLLVSYLVWRGLRGARQG